MAAGKITNKDVIRYFTLPGIWPRLRELGTSGFSHISYFMALIFSATRLLPYNHPYLNPANVGKYGIHHVVAQAAANLRFTRSNIDQVIVFAAILAGIVLLFLQFCFLAFGIFVSTAHAGMGGAFAPLGFFTTPNPTHDLAFIMMDRVFGIPDLFNSCVAQGVPCIDSSYAEGTYYTNSARTASTGLAFPYPYHEAFHGMLQFYSSGLLVVAVFIFLYFIMAVVVETAETGTPFGKRFNHTWAPIRMVVALGLLIPIANGLNSAQYITLYAAKLGSGFATNGWNLFVDTAVTGTSTVLGDSDTLVTSMNPPEVNTLMEFATVLGTCVKVYEGLDPTAPAMDIDAWLVNGRNTATPRKLFSSTSYKDAVEYYGNRDIIVRFGHFGKHAGVGGTETLDYPQEEGNVYPACGELVLPLTDNDIGSSSSQYMLEWYYGYVQLIWAAVNMTGPWDGTTISYVEFGRIGHNLYQKYIASANLDPDAPIPNAAQLRSIRDLYQQAITINAQTARSMVASDPRWIDNLKRLGWGGAAIWYNKLAQLNGAYISSVYNMPVVKKYPDLMELVRREREITDREIRPQERYKPELSNGTSVNFGEEGQWDKANAMYQAQKLWIDAYSDKKLTGNVIMDAIYSFFGLDGLISIQENTAKGVHPLALLVGIGRSMVDAALRHIGYAVFSSLGGGVASILGAHVVGSLGSAASGFFTSVALMGLSVGFLLFYVIPFFPFLYFFFGVATWVKEVFEAMVGLPLWALAHIRIDGHGLPGDAAMGGYFLILEIFLRPIMVVFGLLASIIIFSAQVNILHEVWPLVTSNITGFDVKNATAAGGPAADATGGILFFRGIVDRFFFTVVYAIVVYMVGMASFKLIDLIPNQILRWMGAQVQTYADSSGEQIAGVMQNTMMQSQQIAGQLGSAGKNVNQAKDQAAESLKKEIMGRGSGGQGGGG